MWPSPLRLNQSYLCGCRWKWQVRLSSAKNQVYFLKAYVKSINKMLIEVEENVIFPVVKIDIFYAILCIC